MKSKVFNLILLGILMVSVLGSCQKADENYAVITGTYQGITQGKEIHLSKVAHGRLEKVATTNLGEDGRFAFKYAIDEPGLYVVNIIWQKGQRQFSKDHNLNRFYLDNGTEVSFNMYDGKYELLESNCAKNNLLTEWNNQVDSLYTFSHGFPYKRTDYTEFFPQIERFAELSKSFNSKINTGDDQFDEFLSLMTETDVNYAAVNFLFTPRPKHAQKKDYPEFYDQLLSTRKPKSELIVKFPFGMAYLSVYTMFTTGYETSRPKNMLESTKMAMNRLDNPVLKGYFGAQAIQRFAVYDQDFIALLDHMDEFLVNDYLRTSVSEHGISIRKFTDGSPAFNFSGKTVQNQEVKLSDFKGQVVYIDAWATWCQPCKAEIPFLQKIEQHYHGKPVTFLSISLDNLSSREAWANMVEEKQLGGVQLIADKGFESGIAKAFEIKTIPRFILIDQDGNIVSTNAPRPSSGKVQSMINDLL